MAAHKCMLFFFDQGRIWSETYYYVANDLYEAMDALHRLAIARLPLISEKVVLGKLRVSREPADRNVLEAGVPQAPRGPASALPWDSVVVDIYARGGPLLRHYERAMSLRGLPKGYCDPDSPWPERFQLWLNILVELGFCMRVFNRDLPTSPIEYMKLIGNEHANPLGGRLPHHPKNLGSYAMLISTKEEHGISATNLHTGKPSLVKILGMRWKFPNGQVENLFPKPLTVLGADQHLLAVKAQLPDVGTLVTPGKVRSAESAYYKFTRAKATYDPIHRTGGRSKVKLSVLPPWNPNRAFTNKIGRASITEEYIPPPQFGPPFVPQEAVTHTIYNAYDLIRFVDEGYYPHADGIKYQITISAVLNMANTWLVVASGTDLEAEAATGIGEDISSSFGGYDDYVGALWHNIKIIVPKGGQVILAGDSLGGMEIQSLLKYLTVSGHKCTHLITFNSPQTTIFYKADHTVRFAELGDLVICSTVMGLMYAALGNPEQTFLPEGDWSINPIRAHKAIYTDLNLAHYDALGYDAFKKQGAILQLGTQHDFTATAPPTPWDDLILTPK